MRMIDADVLERKLMVMPDEELCEDCCYNVVNAISEMPTIGGWISVKDKLPDKQGVYLVAFKPPFPKVTIAWWATTEFGWYDLEYNFYTDGISHWMPLPPMPEQEVTGDD